MQDVNVKDPRMPRSYSGAEHFTLERLTGRIGAEVSGIDLRQPLSTDIVDALSAALVDHKVLFFRDQRIDREEHVSFARNFGPLEVHPFLEGSEAFFNAKGCEEVIVIESRGQPGSVAQAWHSDLCCQEAPPMASILSCKIAPSVGGDTLWADMVAAYEGLDDATRSLISDLVAVNDWHDTRNSLRKRGIPESRIAELQARYPAHEHPVVRTHPVSGRKLLYVNAVFTTHIKGMSEAESRTLLERLFRQSSLPDYQVRFRWSENAIAFWDNRSTQHCVVSDFHPELRMLERITISGDRPF